MQGTSSFSAYFASRRKLRDQARERGQLINELNVQLAKLQADKKAQHKVFFALLKQHKKFRDGVKRSDAGLPYAINDRDNLIILRTRCEDYIAQEANPATRLLNGGLIKWFAECCVSLIAENLTLRASLKDKELVDA